MIEEREDIIQEEVKQEEINQEESKASRKEQKFNRVINAGENRYKLPGMFKDWFLDYASYVMLDRAVPYIEDGLKPVQRRIMHTLKLNEDGKYHKVAGIVGETMKFHPHGDASIYDALVSIQQKELLIDGQGNWGNILTGDKAAAPVTSRPVSPNSPRRSSTIPKSPSGSTPTTATISSRCACRSNFRCCSRRAQWASA